MINIKGRDAIIPYDERFIGFEEDNLVEKRMFQITEASLFGYDFKLDLSAGGNKQIVDLEKTIQEDKIFLLWAVKNQHLLMAGEVEAQLRAFNPIGEEKWHSGKFIFVVGDSINATEYFPDPLPSEFEEMETRITQFKNEVEADRAEVATNKTIVAENTAGVIEKASEAMQSAANALLSEQEAKQSEDNAKESELSALDAMQMAVQAMQDLLAMMGNDIATLTGGKLTPSQIPAIAVTDTFVVANEADMLALVAETGDVCIRTDESKTYILQGTDPTILEQWKQLQVPTNYADTAGHASTADEATNATMINNHRVVVMSQSQYDNAVKDPDTVYLVGVE